MPWSAANSYRARIGGVIYRHVHAPVVVNDRPLIAISRNTGTGELAVSFDLVQQDGSGIASVLNNRIGLSDSANYSVLSKGSRSAVIEKRSGRVWCDIRVTPQCPDYELDVSCLLFADQGYPVLLHPDRSKFGTANDNKPPNIALLTLTTEPGSQAAAIALQGAGMYLLGMAIEHFNIGVKISLPDTHGPDKT